ncbi:glycoside hydrolase family 16 protein [Streptomyces sp. CMB-StM0423]|uniref:glycoside hydrolase family 16 protein n=1 Tax=Streptomyces sp. CMB-StM0423 TaxID=2059884 RepID=UPI000C700A81|nr:glycoside hydrolase family 16 protein [Streptomyces sp. CMB-StM0423]AUH43314.1 1,3-beta-glucanase [Streptomyces sp. CMB-StM0423]
MHATRIRWRRSLLGAVAAMAAVSALTLPSATAGEDNGGAASDPAPLAEVFRDDFDGAAGSPPDAANWIVDTGTSYPGGPANWGTGEIQTYTDSPENLQKDGKGNLTITPRRNASGGWASARIETQRTDFEAPAGGVMRIEARIQMPNVTGAEALGYWPAFWTLGDAYRGNYWNWPGIGEFDIMENVNGVDSVWGVLHCGTAPGGPCNENNGLGASRACPGGSCQSGFHEYALELDRSGPVEELRWYVDGQQYHSVNAEQVGAETWANLAHHGHFLLLNVAMGGAFPDGVAGHATPTDATRPGVPMTVDYVSVEQSGGTAE